MVASATRRNIKSDDWFAFRKSSSVSEFSDYQFDGLHLPVAGMRSDKVNHDPRDFDPRNERGGKKCKPDKFDLSLLKMNEDGHCPNKHTLGFKSRVDPTVRNDAAGSESAKMTYNPGKGCEMNWDRRPQKVRKEQERIPNGVNVLHFPKGFGDAHPDTKTDPITHFKHEGKVFQCEFHSSKKCGYDSRATRVTMHLDHTTKHQDFQDVEGNDEAAIEERHQKYKKNLLDAVGHWHYWQGGEEDMIPPATKGYIKCELKPTDDHIQKNDRTQLLWCERTEQPGRYCQRTRSDQMSLVLNHAVGTQSSFGDADSAPSSPRRVMARVRSAPSSLREEGLRSPDRESMYSEPFDRFYVNIDRNNRKSQSSSQSGRSPRMKTPPPREVKSRVRVPQDANRTPRSSTPRSSSTPRNSAIPYREGSNRIPRTLTTPESSAFELRGSAASEVSDASSGVSVALRAALLSSKGR